MPPDHKETLQRAKAGANLAYENVHHLILDGAELPEGVDQEVLREIYGKLHWVNNRLEGICRKAGVGG